METKDMNKAQLIEHIEKLEAEKAALAAAPSGTGGAAQQQEIDRLTGELASKDQEIQQLSTALTDANLAKDDLQLQVDELRQVVQQLNSRSVIQEKVPQKGGLIRELPSGVTVTVIRGAQINNRIYTKAQLAEDIDALEQLVVLKSGSLIIHTSHTAS